MMTKYLATLALLLVLFASPSLAQGPYNTTSSSSMTAGPANDCSFGGFASAVLGYQVPGISCNTFAPTMFGFFDTSNIEWTPPGGQFAVTLANPTAITVGTAASGTLTAGTYYLKLTGVGVSGQTLPSPESLQVTLSSGTQKITASWTAIPGASNYDLYLTPANGASGSENVFYITGNVTSLTLDGTQTPNSGTPPTTNSAMAYSIGPTGVSLLPYTVATLPAAATYAYQEVIVTDATTYTVGTCTGGGSDTMLAVSNGTSWSCH